MLKISSLKSYKLKKIGFFDRANKITKEQMLSVTFYQIVNILDFTTARDFGQLGLQNRK